MPGAGVYDIDQYDEYNSLAFERFLYFVIFNWRHIDLIYPFVDAGFYLFAYTTQKL